MKEYPAIQILCPVIFDINRTDSMASPYSGVNLEVKYERDLLKLKMNMIQLPKRTERLV